MPTILYTVRATCPDVQTRGRYLAWLSPKLGFWAAALLLCFLGEDLAYYWFHRISHEVRILWADHSMHHSAETYDFTVNLRHTPFSTVYRVNPIAPIIEGVRWSLIGGPDVPGLELLYVVPVVLGALVLSLGYFETTQQSFADVL